MDYDENIAFNKVNTTIKNCSEKNIYFSVCSTKYYHPNLKQWMYFPNYFSIKNNIYYICNN